MIDLLRFKLVLQGSKPESKKLTLKHIFKRNSCTKQLEINIFKTVLFTLRGDVLSFSSPHANSAI